MTADSIRRIKNKTTKEENKDFYQTHPTMVRVLVTWLKERQVSEHLRILDPCCGKGKIWKNLLDYFYNINYIDRFLGRRKRSFYLHNKKYDMIIMNPPYSKQKYRFIKKAWFQARYTLALLPYNTSNYNMFHNEFMDTPWFLGKIVMTPKVMLHEGDDLKYGGTTAYAWYIWDTEATTNTSLEWYYNLRDFLKEGEK